VELYFFSLTLLLFFVLVNTATSLTVKLTSFYGSTILVGLGILTVEVPRSHSDTPQSVGILWTSDQLVAETSIWQHITFI
jgi:hypothetical protein